MDDQINDLADLGICIDIISRMAVFSMAKSLSTKEIDSSFDAIGLTISEAGDYEKDKVEALIKSYRDAVLILKRL